MERTNKKIAYKNHRKSPDFREHIFGFCVFCFIGHIVGGALCATVA